jgi:glyoxylase-like metal-dependent hydrolase (beta-lactamase superfamily II)
MICLRRMLGRFSGANCEVVRSSFLSSEPVNSYLSPLGIHVFERGWLSSNNIFFDDGHTSWLVDSGYTTHSDQTLELVASKLGSRSLDFLINTHLHSDHCGGNAALQSQYGSLTTLIPPGQADEVKNWDGDSLTYAATGQQCPRFGFSNVLVPDSSIRLGFHDWEIHAAAGHDPDAVVLFEPIHKILISADALWQNGFGVVFPELQGLNAFDEVGATLDVIEKLDPQIVIPGHGPAFVYQVRTMQIARQRLAAFAHDPVKHARYAVKVLMKFKLLEIQQQPVVDFNQWAQITPYFELCRKRFFKELRFAQFIEQMCFELVQSKAARIGDGIIFNA